MKAERDAAVRECEKPRLAHSAALNELAAADRQQYGPSALQDGVETESEASGNVHYTIIGTQLAVMLGKTNSG